MSNDYYAAPSDIAEHTKAKGSDINSRMGAVESAFDLLPAKLPLQQNRVTYAADTGAANVYVITLAKVPPAYVEGLQVAFKASTTNTGASTLNVNSLGAKPIKRFSGDDVVAGDIPAGRIIHAIYDGTNFQLINGSVAAALGYVAADKAGETFTGNVGIKVSPGSKPFVVSDGANYQIQYNSAASPTIKSRNFADSAYVTQTYDASQHLFYTGGVYLGRFDAIGRLLLGGISSSIFGVSSNLEVNQNSQSSCIITTGSTGAGTHMQFQDAGTGGVGSITTTGASTSFNTTSDYRLKENIVPLEGAIGRLMLLKPYRFNFKAVPTFTVDGFVAHEAAEVVPESVTGEKDATELRNIVDENGEVIGTEEIPKYQGIDQAKLIPLLTAALQEAINRISALEAIVNP